MAILNEPVKKKAAESLAKLAGEVKLVAFTQEMECQFCREATELVRELASLSDRLRVEIHDMVKDTAKAAEYRVDKVPAICIIGDKDYGIRYYGVPSGFEFSTLLGVIELVGGRESGLKPETMAKLADSSAPLDMQMFVTLTCPVCPAAATLGARLALSSDRVSLSITDATEFPQLAGLYSVTAVPKTVVNRGHSFEGALPEDRFVDELLKGASSLVVP